MSSPGALVAAVEADLARRKFHESLAQVDAHLAGAPDDVDGIIRKGILLHAAGRDARALESFWRASRLAPDRHDVRFLIERHFAGGRSTHPEAFVLQPLCEGRGVDVGCGFRTTHPDAIGIDLVPGGQAGTAGVVRGRRSAAQIAASGDRLPVPDASLDFVVARHNLEHYQDPVAALLEWRRVLRQGGMLGLVVPDDAACDTIGLDPTHKHVFTQDSLIRLVSVLGGFDLVTVGPCLFRWSFMLVASRAGAAPAVDHARELIRLDAGAALARARAYRAAGDLAAADACTAMAQAVLEAGGCAAQDAAAALALADRAQARGPTDAPTPSGVPTLDDYFPSPRRRARYALADAVGLARRTVRLALGLPSTRPGAAP